MTTEYHFHEDAGHGWLKVPRKELADLNLTDRISSCSYDDGTFVYLEEDDDAPLFLKMRKRASFPTIIHMNDGDYSPIRNLPHYQGVTQK